MRETVSGIRRADIVIPNCSVDTLIRTFLSWKVQVKIVGISWILPNQWTGKTALEEESWSEELLGGLT